MKTRLLCAYVMPGHERQTGLTRCLKSTFLLFVFSVLIISSKTFAQVAPVNPPAGGFNIDGNVQASTDPVGDWLLGPSSGGYVLHNDGSPVDPTHTFFIADVHETRRGQYAQRTSTNLARVS